MGKRRTPAVNCETNTPVTDYPIEEHNKCGRELQKLNYVAGELLIELRWCYDKVHERRRSQADIGQPHSG